MLIGVVGVVVLKDRLYVGLIIWIEDNE